MFFKRKISRPLADFDGKTVKLLPELKRYGENLICDSVRHCFWDKKEVQLFYQTKFYDTNRQRKWCDWGFSGCVLKISDNCIKGGVYCYNEKVYQRIIPSGYFKVGMLKRFQVYSTVGNDIPYEINRVLEWLEQNLCDILSYTYAVNFSNGMMKVIFCNLYLYPIEIVWERIIKLIKK